MKDISAYELNVKAIIKLGTERDKLQARVEALEAALTLIASMAGTPDAAEGCRNIMKTAVKALGEKE